jgi:hypothetical protein
MIFRLIERIQWGVSARGCGSDCHECDGRYAAIREKEMLSYYFRSIVYRDVVLDLES